MLHRICNVRQRVVLQEFTGLAEVSAASVQPFSKGVQLDSLVLIDLLGWALSHETGVDREIDPQVKFKFLSRQIVITQVDGDRAHPQAEEVLALARVEGLAHVLDRLLLVLDESLALVRLDVVHFVVHQLCSLNVTLLIQVFLNRQMNILLSARKVVQIYWRFATTS